MRRQKQKSTKTITRHRELRSHELSGDLKSELCTARGTPKHELADGLFAARHEQSLHSLLSIGVDRSQCRKYVRQLNRFHDKNLPL